MGCRGDILLRDKYDKPLVRLDDARPRAAPLLKTAAHIGKPGHEHIWLKSESSLIAHTLVLIPAVLQYAQIGQIDLLVRNIAHLLNYVLPK